MSYVSGIGGQSARNAVLEPFRTNYRSPDSPTRAGEVTADVAFMSLGGSAAVGGTVLARRATSTKGLLGSVGLAAVGATAALSGFLNLFAKLPGGDGPGPKPKPDPARPPKPTPQPLPDPQPPIKPKVQHRVRPGETLTFIADCYNVDWRALYTSNRKQIGANPDQLAIGTKLRIPSQDAKPSDFRYKPTAEPGILPAGVYCDANSPDALAGTCE